MTKKNDLAEIYRKTKTRKVELNNQGKRLSELLAKKLGEYLFHMSRKMIPVEASECCQLVPEQLATKGELSAILVDPRGRQKIIIVFTKELAGHLVNVLLGGDIRYYSEVGDWKASSLTLLKTESEKLGLILKEVLGLPPLPVTKVVKTLELPLFLGDQKKMLALEYQVSFPATPAKINFIILGDQASSSFIGTA